MNSSELRALKLIMNDSLSIRELASKLGLSYSRSATVLRGLVKKGYCERHGGRVRLARNVKTSLLKRLALRYDVSLLLEGVSERLLPALHEALSIPEIQRRTGLAQSTVYQRLGKLMAVGAVRKIGDRYVVADESLKSFLEVLRREQEAVEIEPHAVLLYSRHGVKIKRVPAGQEARGSKTAFSLFSKYGLDYFSPYDYYVEPQTEVSIEECFIHALIVSGNKAERTICALFYLKNVDRLDAAMVSALARKHRVSLLLTELQSYVKGLPNYKPENFLPWDEFKEKASIYGITVSPPSGYEGVVRVLSRLGEELDSPVAAYLFGGASLLLRGLKNATKDLDLVVEDVGDFSRLRDALLKLGFRALTEHEMTVTDRRLNPSSIFVADGLPRLDIFTKIICNAFLLTESMEKRSEVRIFGRLELRILSLEDVFLLKSITGREGDLEDMVIIVRQGGGLNWNTVLETYFEEERRIKRHLCFTVLDSIELLQERENLKIPIHTPLLRHCIDTGILQSIHRGATSIKEIRRMMDFPEYMIRNRVAKLVKEGKVSKIVKKNRFRLKLTSKGRNALFIHGS